MHNDITNYRRLTDSMTGSCMVPVNLCLFCRNHMTASYVCRCLPRNISRRWFSMLRRVLNSLSMTGTKSVSMLNKYSNCPKCTDTVEVLLYDIAVLKFIGPSQQGHVILVSYLTTLFLGKPPRGSLPVLSTCTHAFFSN